MEDIEMISETEVKEMPLSQKLRLMEIIWDDLHKESEAYESPDWHRKELEATASRRKAGLEEPMDWDEAKKKLLNR
jgi:hypothetical protein